MRSEEKNRSKHVTGPSQVSFLRALVNLFFSTQVEILNSMRFSPVAYECVVQQGPRRSQLQSLASYLLCVSVQNKMALPSLQRELSAAAHSNDEVQLPLHLNLHCPDLIFAQQWDMEEEELYQLFIDIFVQFSLGHTSSFTKLKVQAIQL
jgi:hypothetical protein